MPFDRAEPPSGASAHLESLRSTLKGVHDELPRIERWGARLAQELCKGARLLTVGNGGSAAEAQHLTAELVGRYACERRPLSAIALHAESSSFTAIVNDYGAEEVFRRQLLAHGRPGDVLLALSTSGKSVNVLTAVEAARSLGMATWAFTGRAPNPLAAACEEAVAVSAAATSTVQEVHLVLVHLLCDAVERALPEDARARPEEGA